MAKIIHHIPTEQFGFTEVEIAEGSEMTYSEAKSLYGANLPSQEGLETKEFNEALDRYLTDGTGETDVYLRMNESQQRMFQEIKKSFARLAPEKELRTRT